MPFRSHIASPDISRVFLDRARALPAEIRAFLSPVLPSRPAPAALGCSLHVVAEKKAAINFNSELVQAAL